MQFKTPGYPVRTYNADNFRGVERLPNGRYLMTLATARVLSKTLGFKLPKPGEEVTENRNTFTMRTVNSGNGFYVLKSRKV